MIKEGILYYGKSIIDVDGSIKSPPVKFQKMGSKWYKYDVDLTQIIDGYAHHYFTEVISMKIEDNFLVVNTITSITKENLNYGTGLTYRIKRALKDFKK